MLAMVPLLCCAMGAQGEPLLMRNQNPLLAPYGIPSPLPARLPAAGRGAVSATLNWANAASIDSSQGEEFTIDGESVELRLRAAYGFGNGFALLGEVPWRQLSGGSLDSLVDNWHDFFGLPNGSRPRLPTDELRIEYARDGVTLLRIDEDTSGIGDMPLSLGYQFAATDKRALAGWLTIKAPIGDSDGYLGSGATDFAASLAGEMQLAEHWQLFGQLDTTWLGNGDLLPQMQESFAWSALAGVSWNAWRSLDLTVQFNANSKVFDSTSTHLAGDAVVLNFGGSYRTQSGWRFDFGIGEDIETEASPDINFNFSVQRGF